MAMRCRIINEFPQPYDKSCTPYQQINFSKEVTNLARMNYLPKLKSKVIFIGNPSVGKTTIVQRFCGDNIQNTYKTTVGVDFDLKNFRILGHSYRLDMWDTAGQERYNSITKAFYRNTDIVVAVYDMTRIDSLSATRIWLDDALTTNGVQNPFLFLVGSKSDLLTKKEFKEMENLGYNFAKGIGAEYWSVSAKTGSNIIDFFNRIAAISFDSKMKKDIIKANFSKRDESVKLGSTYERRNERIECVC